jgi:hypothetical protein
MSTTVRGFQVTRDEGTGRRRVTIALSDLAFEALTESAGGVATPAVRMTSALRCYLRDSETERPAWPYPGFLRGSETQKDVQMVLEVDEGLWRGFAEEADRQGVSIEQLTEHAAFYFAAEVNAGRLTQRILDDFESTEGGSGQTS